MNLLDILPIGRSNAASTDNLVAAGNYRSSRELQYDIRALRLRGVPVISISEAPGGYYIADQSNDIERCYHTMRSRGRETLRAAAAMKMCSKNLNDKPESVDANG